MPTTKKRLDSITVHDRTGEDLTEAVVAMFLIPVGEPVMVASDLSDWLTPVPDQWSHGEEEFATREDLTVMFDGIIERYAERDIARLTYQGYDDGYVFGGTGEDGNPVVSFMRSDEDHGVTLFSLQQEFDLTILIETSDIETEPAPAEADDERHEGRLYAHGVALEGDEDPREVDFLHAGGPAFGTRIASVYAEFRSGESDGVHDEFVVVVDYFENPGVPSGTDFRVVVNGDSVYEDTVL